MTSSSSGEGAWKSKNLWNGQRMSLQQGLPILQWNGLMETSPNWQLPILWSGVSPSSAVWGTYSKMDRWMSLQRGFPILQKMKDFYVLSRGTEEGGSCPKTLNQCEDWLDQPYRREGPSKHWKVAALLLYNAQSLLNMEIWYVNNK